MTSNIFKKDKVCEKKYQRNNLKLSFFLIHYSPMLDFQLCLFLALSLLGHIISQIILLRYFVSQDKLWIVCWLLGFNLFYFNLWIEIVIRFIDFIEPTNIY